ncbi:uncharacterized protein LOC110737311 [Chenopodium quinoa]|uniref:uncharacterized protein LOC110737311 n=1 Tax=Chenopodium quinoa TaxID=63459 RepID=UPI000B79814A|nr:uncharacterized protein LOC110737311 [Chenopodium quinoa]
MVDATTGHELLSFMDAYSGYNQILMHKDDQEKTAFITSQGIYWYKVMPFGLKNAGATYQWLVNKMFEEQIGNTIEVYIDDMVVMSKKAEDHVRDLREAFAILKQYGMKLNPTICTFGVQSGKFLGYMVTQRGIEASPDQVKAILDLERPKSKKEVQSLTGKIAALNRFISKSSDKNRAFYEVLKKNKEFKWEQEHDEAFQKLKEYLANSLILSKLRKEIHSSYTSQCLKGRSVESSQEKKTRYDIQYEPRTTIKSQALADFVVDFSPTLEEEAQKEVLALQEPKATQKWILHTDGAANIRRVGLGIVLTSPEGDKIAQAIRCNFKATNNEAEYEALITRLTVAKDMKIQHLEVISDSLLMVNQVNGEYATKDARMIAYLEVTKKLIKEFKEFKIDQVPRNLNTEADALANLGSNINPEEFGAIPLVHVLSPAIEKESTVSVYKVQENPTVKEGNSWTTPLKEYLLDMTKPTGKVAAQALAQKASKYCLICNVLFKKSVACPFLRCLEVKEAQQVLQSLHSGECGNHSR